MTGTWTAGDQPLLERASAAVLEALAMAPYHWVAPLVAGRRVLDAGCRVGHGATVLATGGAAEVVAVAETEAVVEIARSETPPGVLAQRADLNRLPFGPASFDVVVSFEARRLGGTERVAEVTTRVAELLRVVKPEGQLVVSVEPHAVSSVRGLLNDRRGYVTVVDQHPVAGSEVRWETPNGASDTPAVRTVSVLADTGLPGGSGRCLILASDAPIPSLDPVVVAFDLGSVDRWLGYSNEQDRRLEELESRIEDLERQLRDRDRLRRELRAAEQNLAVRISSYEKAVQNASLQTAERYQNTISWRLTSPVRRSKPPLKRLFHRVVRAAR